MKALFSRRNNNSAKDARSPDDRGRSSNGNIPLRARTTSAAPALDNGYQRSNPSNSFTDPMDCLYPDSAKSKSIRKGTPSIRGSSRGTSKSKPSILSLDGGTSSSFIPLAAPVGHAPHLQHVDDHREQSDGPRNHPFFSSMRTKSKADGVGKGKERSTLHDRGVQVFTTVNGSADQSSLSSPGSHSQPIKDAFSPSSALSRSLDAHRQLSIGGTTSDAASESAYSAAGPSRIVSQLLQPPFHKHQPRSAPVSPRIEEESGTSPSSSVRTANSRILKELSSNRLDGRENVNGHSAGERDIRSHTVPSFRPRQFASISRSQGLANQLNELAVAFEEGLLGEEEYRILRLHVFEQTVVRGEDENMQRAKETANEHQIIGMPAYGDRSIAASSASIRTKGSARSNLTSLFRRGSKSSRHNINGHAHTSQFEAKAGNESIWSVGALSSRSRESNAAALELQISEARRARTIRSGHHSSGAMRESFASGIGRGGPLSVAGRDHSVYSSKAVSLGGVTISSGNALLGANYREKSSDEIQAEIAVVEAEGKRILEGFRSLQINTVGRYNLSYTQLKQVMRGMNMEERAEEGLLDDFVLIDGQEDMSTNGKGAGDRHSNEAASADFLSGILRKSRSFGSIDILASGSARKNKSKGEQSTPPSSYRGVWRRDPTSASPSSAREPVQKTTSTTQYPPDWADKLEEEDEDVLKLRAELQEYIRRRDEVSKKYTDRIAFLKSSLRSAKIREGLK